MLSFKIITKENLEIQIENYKQLILNWEYCNWNSENFLYELPNKWRFSFSIHNENDKLIGFCFASNKIQDVYYIHLLFVSNHLRGAGIGGEIIKNAIKIAKENKINKIELRCPESNVNALKFYQKNNFKIISVLNDETSGNEKDNYLQLVF